MYNVINNVRQMSVQMSVCTLFCTINKLYAVQMQLINNVRK